MVAALIWMQPETSSSKSKHRGFLLNSNKRISWGWRPTNMIWATITGFFNYDYHVKPKNLTCALRLLKRIPQIAQPPWRFRETLGTADANTRKSPAGSPWGDNPRSGNPYAEETRVIWGKPCFFLRVQIKCAWIFKYIHPYGIQRNKKCTASERLGSPTEVLRYTALPCCPVQSLWPSLLLMSLEDLPHTHGPNVLGHQQLWEFRDWSKSITPYFLRGRPFIYIYIHI